jgi:hypothetical protein
LSKKKRIIISVVAAVLAVASLVPVVGLLTTTELPSDDRETQGETFSKETTMSEDTIPPVDFPIETDTEDIRDDIILDVEDFERDPEPGVVDAVIEYETKGGNPDDE